MGCPYQIQVTITPFSPNFWWNPPAPRPLIFRRSLNIIDIKTLSSSFGARRMRRSEPDLGPLSRGARRLRTVVVVLDRHGGDRNDSGFAWNDIASGM